jgi:hypothetical protein
MLAIALYPDAMRKAQHEMDVVVGRGRLPMFSYALNLPYLRAMILEVATRWTVRLVVRRLVEVKRFTILLLQEFNSFF